MKRILFLLLLVITSGFFFYDAYACSVALSTDKTNYDLGEKMIISVWTWPDNCNDGEKENVKVTIFGNGQPFKNLLVGNEPIEYGYSIGLGYKEGDYKIYAKGSNSNTEIHVGVGEFESKSVSSNIETELTSFTKIQDGMVFENTGKDPTGSDLWVETDASYNSRIISSLAMVIIPIVIILIVIVVVIMGVRNRGRNKENFW